jgi:hypothetical protein
MVQYDPEDIKMKTTTRRSFISFIPAAVALAFSRRSRPEPDSGIAGRAEWKEGHPFYGSLLTQYPPRLFDYESSRVVLSREMYLHTDGRITALHDYRPG